MPEPQSENPRAPREPGLPAGHPWLALSRWGIAWRIALAQAAVEAVLLGLLATLTVLNGDPLAGLIFLAARYGLWLPVAGGLLAAAIGPWLRRFYPFSQALLFAVILGVLPLVLIGLYGPLISVFDAALEGVDDGFGPEMTLYGLWIFGLPAMLLSTVAYSIAIAASARRRPGHRGAA